MLQAISSMCQKGISLGDASCRRDVLRKSARQEFEATRHHTNPEMVRQHTMHGRQFSLAHCVVLLRRQVLSAFYGGASTDACQACTIRPRLDHLHQFMLHYGVLTYMR